MLAGPDAEERLGLSDALRACVHVGMDNMASLRVKAVELVDAPGCLERGLLLPEMARLLAALPLVQVGNISYTQLLVAWYRRRRCDTFPSCPRQQSLVGSLHWRLHFLRKEEKV